MTPSLPDMLYPALVDTGALESYIDSQLALEMSLPVVDQRDMAGAGGVHRANVYLGQLHIPDLAYTVYGSFSGVNLSEGGQWHRALIGRTFLRQFIMTYNGRAGTVILSNDP